MSGIEVKGINLNQEVDFKTIQLNFTITIDNKKSLKELKQDLAIVTSEMDEENNDDIGYSETITSANTKQLGDILGSIANQLQEII